MPRFRPAAEKHAAMVKACLGGARYADVAREFGVCLPWVSSVARGAGVRNRPHRPPEVRAAAVAYARAHSFAEAVVAFKVSRRALFIWAKEIESRQQGRT